MVLELVGKGFVYGTVECFDLGFKLAFDCLHSWKVGFKASCRIWRSLFLWLNCCWYALTRVIFDFPNFFDCQAILLNLRYHPWETQAREYLHHLATMANHCTMASPMHTLCWIVMPTYFLAGYCFGCRCCDWILSSIAHLIQCYPII